MMHLKFISSLLLSACLWTAASAQSTVTGRVTDDQGQPLPSATVMAKSGKGAFTDLEGKYSLSLAAGEQELTFSFIGFLNTVKKIELADGETKTINVRLQEDAVLLNESIVIGYGVQRKKEVTGNISTIN